MGDTWQSSHTSYSSLLPLPTPEKLCLPGKGLIFFFFLRKTFQHLHVTSCFLTKPYGSRACNSEITRPAWRGNLFPKGGQLNSKAGCGSPWMTDGSEAPFIYLDIQPAMGVATGRKSDSMCPIPSLPHLSIPQSPNREQVQGFLLKQLWKRRSVFLGN